MKLTLKFKLILMAICLLFAGFFGWLFQPFTIRRRRRLGLIALANELAGGLEHGLETRLVDSGQSTPISNSYIGSGKYLLWQVGANSTATVPSAQLCAGGVTATKANMPLGLSADNPYAAGDYIQIARFGAAKGTLVGISAGAITDGDWVVAGASGTVQTAASPTASTNMWCIGKATKTVTAAGQEVSFVPCLPFILNITNGTPNTYAIGTPL